MPGVDRYSEIVDRLCETGVFTVDDSNSLQLTESFRRTRTREHTSVSALSEKEITAEIEEFTESTAIDPGEINRQIIADTKAIEQYCVFDRPEDHVVAAYALYRLAPTRDESLPNLVNAGSKTDNAGVPDGYIPLVRDEITPMIEGDSISIVYCWREDCPPCDIVKEQFEALLADDAIHEEILLGAVHGRDAADFLSDRYDVTVAPTTLFCSADGIEARIVGSMARDTLASEIAILEENIE